MPTILLMLTLATEDTRWNDRLERIDRGVIQVPIEVVCYLLSGSVGAHYFGCFSWLNESHKVSFF